MLKKTIIAGVTVAALAVGGVVAAEAANAGPSAAVAHRTSAVAQAAVAPAGSALAVVTPAAYPSSMPTLTGLRVVPLFTHNGRRTWLYVKVVAPGYFRPGYRAPTGLIVVWLGRWHTTVSLRNGMATILLPKLSVGHARLRAFPIYAKYYPTPNSIWRTSGWVKTYAFVVR